MEPKDPQAPATGTSERAEKLIRLAESAKLVIRIRSSLTVAAHD